MQNICHVNEQSVGLHCAIRRYGFVLKSILILIPITTSSWANENSEKEKAKGGTETRPGFCWMRWGRPPQFSLKFCCLHVTLCQGPSGSLHPVTLAGGAERDKVSRENCQYSTGTFYNKVKFKASRHKAKYLILWHALPLMKIYVKQRKEKWIDWSIG